MVIWRALGQDICLKHLWKSLRWSKDRCEFPGRSMGTPQRPFNSPFSEMLRQLWKALQNQQLPRTGRHVVVLQAPGVVVWDEDGVPAIGERRIDIRFRRVADHPGFGGIERKLAAQLAVGRVILLGHDLDVGKKIDKSRAIDFEPLFLR